MYSRFAYGILRRLTNNQSIFTLNRSVILRVKYSYDQSNVFGKRRWLYLRPNSIACGTSLGLIYAINFFKRSDEEESPEDKLVATIKRSILCIQREQYDKAEQMLHLALRMAQDLQNKDGITYVFDVMANLAMEREQFKKAEKLFTDVMKRLFAEEEEKFLEQQMSFGSSFRDIVPSEYQDKAFLKTGIRWEPLVGFRKYWCQMIDEYLNNLSNWIILHISSKIAHMAQLQGELEKALQGFTWTLKKIEENLKKMPDDKDIQELFGLTKNWFGQLQMKLGNYKEAKKLFTEAHDCLIEVYGKINEEAITILNNLSVVCVYLEDFKEAKEYILQALDIVKELKDVTQEGILKANLGLIYLREGLVTQAKEICGVAWKIGKQTNNADAVEQAEYCLNEIKHFTK